MLLYVNPDLQLVVEQPNNRQPVSKIKISRGHNVPLVVRFCRNGAVYDPTFIQTSGTLTVGRWYKITTYVSGDSFTNIGAASNATNQYFQATGATPTTWSNGSTLKRCDPDGVVFSLRFVVKKRGERDGPSYVSVADGDFTKIGSGTSTQFEGLCDYATAELNALLGVNPPTTSDDEASVELDAELSWVGPEEDSAAIVQQTLRNNLYKGDDEITTSTPVAAIPFVTTSASALLGGEKVLTAGSNITITVGASTVTISAASAGHVIQEEGTPLTQRAALNFVGDNVTATDDSGNSATKVTISGVKRFYVKDYGAVGDGTTDDSEAILDACQAAHALGNSIVEFDGSKVYRVTQLNGAAGPVLYKYPTVSFEGNNCTIKSTHSAAIFGTPYPPATTTVTVDAAAGDQFLTVASAADLQVGDNLFVRWGDLPEDVAEAEDWFFAQVVSISGNVVQIDRPVPAALDVSETTSTNKTLHRMRDGTEYALVDGTFIRNFKIYPASKNDYASSAVEYGTRIICSRNLTVENVTGYHLGCGLTHQFTENCVFRNCSITQSEMRAQASLGVGFGFAEAKNSLIENGFAAACQGNFITAEAKSSVRVSNFLIDNSWGAKTTRSITGISVANPTQITAANHGLQTGYSVYLYGTASTPSLDGLHTVTKIDANNFTVAVNVTVAGSLTNARMARVRAAHNAINNPRAILVNNQRSKIHLDGCTLQGAGSLEVFCDIDYSGLTYANLDINTSEKLKSFPLLGWTGGFLILRGDRFDYRNIRRTTKEEVLTDSMNFAAVSRPSPKGLMIGSWYYLTDATGCTGLVLEAKIAGVVSGTITDPVAGARTSWRAGMWGDDYPGMLDGAHNELLVTGDVTAGTVLRLEYLSVSASVDDLSRAQLEMRPEYGAGVAAFLATPSSANLAAALTDETGTGAAVFATSPTLVTPELGAATATSINGLVVSLGGGAIESNVAIGEQSPLGNNVSGLYNVAVGGLALLQNNTGVGNTAVGYQAAQSGASGSNTSAFGWAALSSVTSGAGNTGIGSRALGSVTTGAGNVALGYYAGYHETGSDSFYVNNQNRSNLSGDRTRSLIYGTFAATAVSQQLTFNVGTITATEAAASFGSIPSPGEIGGATAAAGTFTVVTSGKGSASVPAMAVGYSDVGLAASAATKDLLFITTGSLRGYIHNSGYWYFISATQFTGGCSIHTSAGQLQIGVAGDLGIARNAAGVLEINSNTAGVLRNLTLRNIQVAVLSASYGASYAIDLSTEGYETMTLTGNITFTTSNRVAGRSKTIRLICDGTNRTLTFPAWKWVGAAAPAEITASKTAILTITAFGTADTDIVAAYAVEP